MRAIGAWAGLSFAASTWAAEPSPFAIDIPKWFAQSFLDFRDEVRDAAVNGKRVMVYVGQDGCPYCRALMERDFGERDIAETTQREFVSIALNLWGDRETRWTDGVKRSEKELARFLRVQFTPTLLFLDESGGVALRVNGFQPPARFRLALEYAGRRVDRDKTFARFLAERASAGKAEAPKASAPVALDAKNSRPTALLFTGANCDACAEMDAVLERPEVKAQLRSFDLVRLDPKSEYGARFNVGFPPTFVFLDADKKEVFRIDGYVRAFHLAGALAYVAEGAWRLEPSFQRYLQAHADRERAAGRSVPLW